MTLALLNNERSSRDVDLDSLDLKTTDFENVLNVYQDSRKNWYYNMNNTVHLEIDENLILTYVCTHESHWPLISYKIYGTTRLAWLLMKLNNIDIRTAFNVLYPGDEVKYIDKSYVTSIITALQNYN